MKRTEALNMEVKTFVSSHNPLPVLTKGIMFRLKLSFTTFRSGNVKLEDFLLVEEKGV
jgi:hypothetical protein